MNRAPTGPWWRPRSLRRKLVLGVLAVVTVVVLVVGVRLGCINHALLTADAIKARGLKLVGWVANRVDASMQFADENIATIRAWLHRDHHAPLLGVVPRLDPPTPETAANHLDTDALLAALRALAA